MTGEVRILEGKVNKKRADFSNNKQKSNKPKLIQEI